MKRYHLNKTILFLLAVLFSITIGCKKDKESEGLSKVTSFVQIELTGGEVYSHRIGTPYSEPGFSAVDPGDNNKNVTNQVVVTGSDDVDPDVAGVYEVTYSVNNSDGFNTTVVRQVVVFDNSSVSNIDISGIYDSKVLRTNTDAGSSSTRPSAAGSFYTITIKKITTGLFSIDDYLGGWYWIGSAYGAGYAYSGLFVLKADNSIALVSADMTDGWEDGIILDSGPGEASNYNPATQTISLFSYMGTVNYLRFALTLTKRPE